MSFPQPPPKPGPSNLPVPVSPTYAWVPKPPKENWPIVLIVVLVVIVLLPIALSGLFFGLGPGVGPTSGPPDFFLGPVDQSNGNASVLIFAVQPVAPDLLRFTLEANEAESPSATFPPPDGFAAVAVGGHTVRLFWIDPNRDRLLGSDDVLWITGDRAPLPTATTFRFTLTTDSGSTRESVTWTTGPV